MENKAHKTLEWAKARFNEGYNVYFSTAYRHIKVTPKNKDVLKVTKDGLRVNGDLVTSNSQLLTKVTASFN